MVIIIHILCFSIGRSFFLLTFKSSFYRKDFSTLQGRGRLCVGGQCLCSFSRALGAISIHQALPHPFFGPGPRAWWKITGMWTKDRNGPDLEQRGKVHPHPHPGQHAGPAFPPPCRPPPPPPPPPQPGQGCHLQTLIHHSFRKWLLPSCLPAGLPHPIPP